MVEIKGFEGLYAVTEDGRVWSHRNNIFLAPRGSGFAGKVFRKKRGYKTICLRDASHKRVYFYIHRLVADTYLTNPQKLPMVNHKDGNKGNNSTSNLEWCTHKQNVEHAFKNGFTTRGALNPNTKLTPAQVKEIRTLEGKISMEEIAKRFGVSRRNIGVILRRKTWFYV